MRISLLYELQREAPGGLPDGSATIHEALEQAVLADELGFHTFWITEHHFLPTFALSPASDLVLAAIAARTERIRIGAGVVILPYHHPVQVAERMATLDILSRGRLEFGTGRGGAYEQTGFDLDPRETRDMWSECLDAVTRIWETYPDQFSWEGRYWNVPPRVVVPQPVQAYPRTWVAALQPDTYRVAGEKGIGVLAFVPNAPSVVKPEIDAYRERIASCTESGKRVNNTWASFTLGYCAADNARARETGAGAIKKFFGPGRPYAAAAGEIAKGLIEKWGGEIPDHLKAHFRQGPPGSSVGGNTGTGLGVAAQNEALEDESKQAIWERVDADTLADMGVIIAGNPDSCIAALRQYEEVGVDEMLLLVQSETIPHKDVLASLELFGREVLPAFA